MPSPYFSPGHHHQVVVSLSPMWLHILHFRRSALGWRRAHVAKLTLADGEDNLERVQSELRSCGNQWKIPSGARVQWILAGDILGIVSSSSSDTAEGALPFNGAEIRTQADYFAASCHSTLLWVHKDWVAEIERISSDCGWELVELFARAQLFQREAAAPSGSLTSVIEQEEGSVFLHIFGPEGCILRSTLVEARTVEAIVPILHAEVAAAADALHLDSYASRVLTTSAFVSATGWNSPVQALASVPFVDLLERLWRSRLEGIVVRPTHGEMLKGIKAFSALAVVVGLVGLSIVTWHDGKLKEQISAAQSQARIEAPKVSAAKVLNTQTRMMSKVLGAVRTVRAKASAFDSFRQLLANFPPAPAALLYVRVEPDSMSFAGSGTDESVAWLNSRVFPGFEALTDSAVPDFLRDMNPSIHFEARKTSSVPDSQPQASAAKTEQSTSTGNQ